MSFSKHQPIQTFSVAAIAACVAALLLNPLALGPSTAVWPNLLGVLAVGVCMGMAALTGGALPLSRASKAAPWLLALAAYTLVHSALLGHLSPVTSLFVFTAVAMFCLGAWLQCLPASVVAPALAYGLLAAAITNALIGWLQYVGLSQPLSPWVNQLVVPGQVYGNLRQPNQYASLMSLGLAALWYLALSRLAWRAPLVLAILSLLVSGVVFSGSRTGALELGVLSCAAWLWRARAYAVQKRWLAYGFMALLLVYLLESAAVRLISQWLDLQTISALDRFAQTDGLSRRSLWHNVIHLIATQPVSGYGVHELGFAHFDADFAQLRWWPYKGRHLEFFDNAHNALLQAWVELGLVGMLLMLLPLALGTIKARPWCESAPGGQLAWLVIAVLGLHSLLEYPLYYAQFWLPFCLALSVVFSRDVFRPSSSDTSDSNVLVAHNNHGDYDISAASMRIYVALAAALLVAFVYMAWDYDRVSQAYSGPHKRPTPAGVDRMQEAQRSWLFKPYALFASAMVTPVTADKAAEQAELLRELLHFSAEPRVLDKLLQALAYQQQAASEGALKETLRQEATALEQRYAAAFPSEYEKYKASRFAKPTQE